MLYIPFVCYQLAKNCIHEKLFDFAPNRSSQCVADPEEGAGDSPPPPGRSQTAIGFLKFLVQTPIEKQLDSGHGLIASSREVRMTLYEIHCG